MYHFTPTRMAIINIHTQKTSVGKDVEKMRSPYIVGGTYTGITTVENN